MKKTVLLALLLLFFPRYHQEAVVALPTVMILGDQYNFGGRNPRDLWGYRKPLQALLGTGRYDWVGLYETPVMPFYRQSAYDADFSALFGQTIGLYLQDIPDILKKTLDPQAKDGWIILFMGASDILDNANSLQASVVDLMKIVEQIDRFNPFLQVIIPRLPPAANKSINKKVKIFNRLLFFQLQTWWRIQEKKNLYAPDLYHIISSIPGYRTRLLSPPLFLNRIGWQVIAEVFYDIMTGQGNNPLDEVVVPLLAADKAAYTTDATVNFIVREREQWTKEGRRKQRIRLFRKQSQRAKEASLPYWQKSKLLPKPQKKHRTKINVNLQEKYQ